MDLKLSDGDEAFRAEVREFLEQSLGDELRQAGRLSHSRFPDYEAAMAWQRILYQKGWLASGWPVEFGGTGWSIVERYIFAQESSRAEAPSLLPMGLDFCGPMLIGHGSEEQKAHYLPKILSGEHVWCQGYSEPGAGSDLASLITRADKSGDDYLVNGSKIWTSYAHFANWIFALVRTSHEGKPQAGISFLLIEMNSPGISVRPIVNIAGAHEFNQVFFEDVRVPQANRVGDQNAGWNIAKYLLEFERFSMGSIELRRALEKVRKPAGRSGDLSSALRRRAAKLNSQVQAIEISEQRVMSELSAGQRPGPASSMLKSLQSETCQQIDELAIDAAGLYCRAWQPETLKVNSNVAPVAPPESLTVLPSYLSNRMRTIAGGSAQVQRNIMAKAILGLS